jgi:hypothetical protein
VRRGEFCCPVDTRFRREWQDGVPVQQMAMERGLTKPRISEAARRAGLPRRHHSRQRPGHQSASYACAVCGLRSATPVHPGCQ